MAKLIDGKSMHSFNLNSFLCDDGDAIHDHDNDEDGHDNDNSNNEQYQTSIYTTPKLSLNFHVCIIKQYNYLHRCSTNMVLTKLKVADIRG